MQIEVLGIAGSPIKGGNTEFYLKEALKAAEATGEVTASFVSLAGREIRDCIHCNWCVRKQTQDRFCNQEDGMAEIYPQVIRADALLLATPVYITRLSGYLANCLDRFRALSFGKVYHDELENKVGGALAVAWFRHTGPETALMSIVSAFMVMGMIPVGPKESLGSPFGAAALSSEGGTGKFTARDRHGVLKDEYGLKAARYLGARVATVTKLLKSRSI